MSDQEAFDDFGEAGGEPLKDSTQHGWGFEISVMQREAKLRAEWEECLARIKEVVMDLVEDRMGECDVRDDPEAYYLVHAITDSILTLRSKYTPLAKRMDDLMKETTKMRGICHSPEE